MRGKVKIGQYECALVQDHPRLCGEKSPASPHKPMTPGSPPPMRGKVESGYLNDDGTGITPAYAGKRLHT